MKKIITIILLMLPVIAFSSVKEYLDLSIKYIKEIDGELLKIAKNIKEGREEDFKRELINQYHFKIHLVSMVINLFEREGLSKLELLHYIREANIDRELFLKSFEDLMEGLDMLLELLSIIDGEDLNEERL